ncbi:MAG TPA: diacylglycerol kinase [Patescibacteria group bacterium]|nr:diacylglycerol kinase [Patescibacteria group bacterium]
MPMNRFVQSFRDAYQGIKYVAKTEQNFRIQIAGSVVVLVAMIVFPLENWERVVVILLVSMVLIMELLNTALERFADLLKPRLHHYVLVIKDIMAGAVLLTALAAILIGSIIFFPHFIALFR